MKLAENHPFILVFMMVATVLNFATPLQVNCQLISVDVGEYLLRWSFPEAVDVTNVVI